MSTRSRHLVRLAVAFTAFLVAPATASAEENIDAFARAHLKASQDAQEDKAAGNGPSPDGIAPDVTSKPARADLPPELLFIQGVENTTVAYLRVDGRFGHTVKRGDHVGEWQVVSIGDDFVDVKRHGKPARLLLPDALAVKHAAQGRHDGDDR
ncbi:hypothetical protein [Pandoraea norimbergensis]|uniref:hypothetical protein n=1 Tax=Pandoraea norimbergensis TaxID=93219 RepID=UPI001428AC32|nr:hypothetical protein [Pandoraea norimbergensis]